MDTADRIHLRDYIVAADIGAFQTERGQTQRLRFNLEVDLAEPALGVNDDVDRILSYDVLIDAITAGLADQRYNLLETLAEKIAAEVLRHPRADRIAVTVEKLDRAPGALGVTLTRRAGRVAADGGLPSRPLVVLDGGGHSLPDGAVLVMPDAPGLPLPGGGADRQVRLLALDQAAWVLAARLGLTVADSRTELDWAVTEGRAVVWAPARMIADVGGQDADPVALAIWLSERMQARALLLPPGLPAPHHDDLTIRSWPEGAAHV